ncbi:MAG: hypothetical protein II842_07545 [Butyrivibrio sp.]|nr:hypothetical protein [Butyrivibrio sp.]
MRIQQNRDAQYNLLQNQDEVSKKSSVGKFAQHSGNSSSVSGTGVSGDSVIQQRQGVARKQALKVASDAFEGEKRFDAQMQAIRDEINNLQNEISEKNSLIGENNSKLKELQKKFGIDPNNADIKNQNYDNFSDEELENISEYQKLASPLLYQNESMTEDIEKYKSMQMGYVRGYSDIMDSAGVQKNIISDTPSKEDAQGAVNSEITNILNRMSLLPNDVKGSTIDNQI